MGKIIASYLVKVHLHAPDLVDEDAIAEADESQAPTNDDVKQNVIDGLAGLIVGGEVTVSLIEKTDN